MARLRTTLSVVGGAVCAREVEEQAHQIGRAIAKAGCSLVCGGYGGVMAAACRGAQEQKDELPPEEAAKVTVIGVLRGERRTEGNPYLDIAIPTGMGMGRNTLVVLSGDAVIAVGGSSGSLSEIALAWQHGKPIVALKGSGGWADRLIGMTLDDRRSDPILGADTPEEAVATVLRLLGR